MEGPYGINNLGLGLGNFAAGRRRVLLYSNSFVQTVYTTMLRNRVAGWLQHCYQGLQGNQIGGVNDFLIPTPESGLKPQKSENPKKNRPKSDHHVNNK